MAASQGECTTGEYDPDIWFPVSEQATREIDLAKYICGTCPIRMRCLASALKQQERFGIWGGLTAMERTRIGTYEIWRIEREAAAEEADEQRARLVSA